MPSRSDHFDGRRFYNPVGPAVQPLIAVPRMMAEPKAVWPAQVEVTPVSPPSLGDATAMVTFIGHSTFLIQTATVNLLTDPMYSDRAGPFNVAGPRRVRRPAVPFDALPDIGLVLLSHNHYDHCDVRTLRQLARRFNPLVVTLAGNGALLRSIGVSRVEELDWWEVSAATPLPVRATPAHHFSARGVFDRNRALWGGFVIDVATRRLFFAGDSAYSPLFAAVRERLGPIDLALLPIGAYEPRWFMRSVHMNPEESVQAHLDLGAAESIGMHFGTFQLTTEGIDEPVRALGEALRARGLSEQVFRTLPFGGSAAVR